MSSEAHSKHFHQYLPNLGMWGRRRERAISVQRGAGGDSMDTNGPKAQSQFFFALMGPPQQLPAERQKLIRGKDDVRPVNGRAAIAQPL